MPDDHYPKKLLQRLKPRLPEMLATLERLVRIESPSLEKSAADRCCKVLAAEWRDSETGREAKFYKLTRKGRALLETEAASWRRLSDAVGLILKLSEGGAE